MSEYISAKALTISACFGVVLIAIVIRLLTVSVVYPSPDELTYTRQANFISEHGLKGYQVLTKEHNQDSSLWIHPSPLRIGYTYPLGYFLKYLSNTTPRFGAFFSLIFSGLNIVIFLIVGLRFLTPFLTLLSLILIATSPIDLELARRCWQDSMFGFFVSLIIYLSLELIFNHHSKRTRILLLIGLTLAGSYLCLIKESGITIYSLLSILLLIKTAFYNKEYRFCILQIALYTLAVGLLFSLYQYLFQGLDNIILMVNHTKNAMPTNEYIITYQNTSSWKTLESLFKMSPISFLCFSATLLSGLFRLQRYRTFDLTCYLSIISAVWILSICSLDYMQNLRYLSTIILPYYLLAALGFYEFIKIIRTSIKNEFIIIAISLLILLGSFYDYYTFQTLLVNKSIGDLSVGLILKYW